MRRSLVLSIPSCLLLALAAGCQPDSPKGAVAVLDLDRAASETGYLRQITTRLDDVRADLQGQLAKVQDDLNAQLASKQEKFGDKPNKEQKEELNKLFATAQLQLQQAQQQALSLINKERSQLVAALHDNVRPYAKQVANARGMQVVLLKGDAALFDHDPATDITNEVIAAMISAKRTSEPMAPAATAPDTAKPQPGTPGPAAAVVTPTEKGASAGS